MRIMRITQSVKRVVGHMMPSGLLDLVSSKDFDHFLLILRIEKLQLLYDWEPAHRSPLLSLLTSPVCVYVSQLAVTGTVECNKSQGKLASSGCTLIHSILLSLCALFSSSPNTETLNLHTQIHQGRRMHGCTRVKKARRHSRRTHTDACKECGYLLVCSYTHAYTLPRGLEPQSETDIWRFSTWSSS